MRLAILLMLTALAGSATAQTAAPARPASPQPANPALEFRDDVEMETYLSMLSQIAPAAREGAEAYRAAFLARCGRALRTVELRRAVAAGDGDPALMAMVRAAATRDEAAQRQAGSRINCPRG